MRLVLAIRRAGRGVCGIGEVSDVVAFRFTVVDCPSRAPFRLLVARLIRWGVGDESMRWSEADEMDEKMDEMDEPHGRKADERRRAADKAGKQRAKRMSR